MEWIVGLALLAAGVYFISRELTRKPTEPTTFDRKDEI